MSGVELPNLLSGSSRSIVMTVPQLVMEHIRIQLIIMVMKAGIVTLVVGVQARITGNKTLVQAELILIQ